MEEVNNRMDAIELLAKGDDRYYMMLKELRELEPKFDAVLRLLAYDQRDIVCDYIMLCEEMSRRVLEIACTHMVFP